jgi:MFS transporter, ACS family, D-galactonate transporter
MTDQQSRRQSWMIVALLFIFMMINFADKIIVGLAGVPIMTDLKLTPKEFGLVGSSFFFLFSVSAVVTGFVVNRIKSKTALLVMGIIWALAQFPMIGTVGIELLIACRIVLGAGEGPAYPVALHATYKWFPNAERALPGAIISQGAALGVIVVVPILTWIITKYSWHHAFGALGVVGLLWVVAWAIFGKEGEIKDTPVAGDAGGDHVPYSALLLSPTNLASWASYFGAYFGLALVLSWFTPYLIKGLGFSQQAAGYMTALPFAVSFFVVITSSFLSERMMKNGASSRLARGLFTGVCVTLGGLALLVEPHIPNTALKIALIVAGVVLPSVVYVLSPAILAEFVPQGQRGAMLGINSAVGTAAGIIAPFVMGSVIEGAATAAEGYSLGFTICGVVTVIGGVVGVLFLRPEAERARLARRSPATPATRPVAAS